MSSYNIANGLQIYKRVTNDQYSNNIDIRNNYEIDTYKNNQDKDKYKFIENLKDKEKETINQNNKLNIITKKNLSNLLTTNNQYLLNYDTNDTSSSYMYTESKKKGNTSSMDNVFKEHIDLKSVMKKDFISNIPFETNESIIPKAILKCNKGSPFIGRTTNSIMFPEFIISPKKKNSENSIDYLKIPFSGNSSYKENYNKFEDRYYKEKNHPIIKKDNLENMGKRIMETTNKESYKNIKSKYNKDKGKNNFKHLYSFSNLGINPPINKDSYLSHYRREYIFNK